MSWNKTTRNEYCDAVLDSVLHTDAPCLSYDVTQEPVKDRTSDVFWRNSSSHAVTTSWNDRSSMRLTHSSSSLDSPCSRSSTWWVNADLVLTHLTASRYLHWRVDAFLLLTHLPADHLHGEQTPLPYLNSRCCTSFIPARRFGWTRQHYVCTPHIDHGSLSIKFVTFLKIYRIFARYSHIFDRILWISR